MMGAESVVSRCVMGVHYRDAYLVEQFFPTPSAGLAAVSKLAKKYARRGWRLAEATGGGDHYITMLSPRGRSLTISLYQEREGDLHYATRKYEGLWLPVPGVLHCL